MPTSIATRMLLCGATALMLASAAAASPTAPEFARVPGAGVRGLSESAVIDGARGGMLTVGRFTLCVPRGALRGETTISLRVPDPSVLACELSVVPAPETFAIPLMLQTDIAEAMDVEAQFLRSVVCNDWGRDWTAARSAIVSLPTHTLYTRMFQPVARCGVVEGTSGW
jgi:hypothetical protein